MNYDFHSMNNLLSNWIKEDKSFSLISNKYLVVDIDEVNRKLLGNIQLVMQK